MEVEEAVGYVDALGVGVVVVAQGVAGALHDCAKYRRKREEGLFSYSASTKTSAKFKNSDVILVTCPSRTSITDGIDSS